jgi:hypothetical protein
MSAFIEEYLFELDQFPRFGNQDLFTIKDYFFYSSNTKEYGCRDILVPKSLVQNNEEVPEESVIRELINNKIPVMKRVVDLNSKKESWHFLPTKGN